MILYLLANDLILILLLMLFMLYCKPYLIDKMVIKESKKVRVNNGLIKCRHKSLDEYTLSELRNAYYVFSNKYRFDYRPSTNKKRKLLEQAIENKLNK